MFSRMRHRTIQTRILFRSQVLFMPLLVFSVLPDSKGLSAQCWAQTEPAGESLFSCRCGTGCDLQPDSAGDTSSECDAMCEELALKCSGSRCGSGWQISFVSYEWLPWIGGKQTVRNHTVNVSSDPIETVEHLDQIPFMGFLEARRGKCSLYTNFSIAGVDYSGSSILYRPRASIASAQALDIERIILEMGMFYEVAQWNDGRSVTSLDFIAGTRYWNYDAAINLEITNELNTNFLEIENNYAIARESNIDWIDPLVGARLRKELGTDRECRIRGDIGGFGVGSKLTWNLSTTYTYPVSICKKSMKSIIGYRILKSDYSRGSGDNLFETDLLIHGPIFGFVHAF